ncbi:sodium/mannose cotransporter SLC5A10-like [Saccostrea echinata]|uniref:sodium/mannose cotransporter SLC5A10-like n=1 Tax=Saccostrea echinata TaxID=191078 RepID=UPI002A80073B|nr:sodium/mannose cotransporter SLC5A10-like [Saccostrea echinata]
MKAGLDNWVDILVLVLYFVFVFVVGILSLWRRDRDTTKGYFLAGRSMFWFPIGASLFASNIGAEHFIGLAGSGASSGIAAVTFEWGAAFCLLMLGWAYLPVYLTSEVYTIPEFLKRRFGGKRLRIYHSLILQLSYIVTKISVDVFAGAVFIQQAVGWNTYLSILVLLAVTAIYTIVGGLAAVIFTDTLQTIIMIVGATALAILSFIKVGGISALMYKYFEAIPQSGDSLVTLSANLSFSNTTYNLTDAILSNVTQQCGLPRSDAFHIFRDPVNSDLPWPGVMIRTTLISTWFWCCDQLIVQRTLAAKNIANARASTIFASYLKSLPMFLIVLPGMISRILFPDTVACVDPKICMEVCENPAGCSNIAYPQLILDLAPTGMRGLMMAVMIAALMSSLTSIFNSAATLFTLDLWARFRKQAAERELLIVGKVFIVLLVGVSVLWIPLIQAAEGGRLYFTIQALTGYLAPPIGGIFLLSIFVPRVNEQGAFWGMLIGHAVGITRMILDFIYPSPKCGEPDTRPSVVADIHFTYFSVLLLGLSWTVCLIVSAFTKAPSRKALKGLTVWTTDKIGPRPQEDYTLVSTEDKREKSEMMKIREISVDVSQETNENSKNEMSKEEAESSSTSEENEDGPGLRIRRKLYMSRKTNIILNINAVILVAVFVFLYAIFA